MDLEQIEVSVKRSRFAVLAVFLATITSYLVWFFFIQNQTISSASSSWGQFGDFIGGILNPLIAFSAFYWLTISVLIQKKELSETKQALIESNKAQMALVEKQVATAKITGLSAIVQGRYQYAAAIGANSSRRLPQVLAAEDMLLAALQEVGGEKIDLPSFNKVS